MSVWKHAFTDRRRDVTREDQHTMRQSRRYRLWPGLLLLVIVLIAAALWNGLVPQRFLPFAALDLSDPDSWLLDFRIAALKSDVELCNAVLKAPIIDAHAIADAPYEKGCGWHNAVSFSQAGGAHVNIDKMTCDLAAAYAMWMTHAVQPAAAEYLNADVRSVQHMGVYACRNIVGSAALKAFRSEHARANAIDVDAFVLSDGRTIYVAKSWKGEGAEAKFLHAIHDRACRYFRVALGPDYNAAHSNHFHLDRGAFKSCR